MSVSSRSRNFGWFMAWINPINSEEHRACIVIYLLNINITSSVRHETKRDEIQRRFGIVATLESALYSTTGTHKYRYHAISCWIPHIRNSSRKWTYIPIWWTHIKQRSLEIDFVAGIRYWTGCFGRHPRLYIRRGRDLPSIGDDNLIRQEAMLCSSLNHLRTEGRLFFVAQLLYLKWRY
jgi:hypothetical protein